MKLYDTGELLMAQKILESKYPGGNCQTIRKEIIRAELKRRRKMENRGIDPQKAELPRPNHWREDFEYLWWKAITPFRRLKECGK